MPSLNQKKRTKNGSRRAAFLTLPAHGLSQSRKLFVVIDDTNGAGQAALRKKHSSHGPKTVGDFDNRQVVPSAKRIGDVRFPTPFRPRRQPEWRRAMQPLDLAAALTAARIGSDVDVKPSSERHYNSLFLREDNGPDPARSGAHDLECPSRCRARECCHRDNSDPRNCRAVRELLSLRTPDALCRGDGNAN